MTGEGILKNLHQVAKIRYQPILLCKIGRAFFRTLVLRKPVLRAVEFSITTRCQSNCVYCYATKFIRGSHREMSLDEILHIWTQAKSMGSFCATLLGGEPTLHPRFLDIMRALEPRKHIVTFSTNCLSLDEPMIRELGKMGCFLVVTSLNSVDPRTNDKVRGHDGHHQKVMDVISWCKKYRMDVQLNIATSRTLIDETMRLFDFAASNRLLAGIVPFVNVGRAEDQADLLDVEFWGRMREIYRKNHFCRGDWDTNLTLKIECPAGYEKVHITPYGEVTGCSLQPVSFGDCHHEPLETIVRRMRSFHHFAKRFPGCLIGFDQDYIRDYVKYSARYPTTPYRVEDNPCYRSQSVPSSDAC